MQCRLKIFMMTQEWSSIIAVLWCIPSFPLTGLWAQTRHELRLILPTLLPDPRLNLGKAMLAPGRHLTFFSSPHIAMHPHTRSLSFVQLDPSARGGPNKVLFPSSLFRLRDDCFPQNGLISWKTPNGLWPPHPRSEFFVAPSEIRD